MAARTCCAALHNLQEAARTNTPHTAEHAVTEENVRSIRPAYGLKPKYYKEILGRKANKAIQEGTPLAWEDIE